MSIYVEMCHCGHHKDTHHDGGNGDCLGMGCNDCKGYRDAEKPDTLNHEPERPRHASWCQCYSCKRYEEWHAAQADKRRRTYLGNIHISVGFT